MSGETGATLTPEILARALDELWNRQTLPSLLRWPGWVESHATCCTPRLLSVPDLDWTVEADGYRLVIRDGAIIGLECPES